MDIKPITTNKKAYHDFFIEDVFETGIELVGSEVKSIRQGGVTLKDSYAITKNGEILLIGAHISPYKMATVYKPDPLRIRKLLLHKSEIRKLTAKVQQKGYTLVVTKLYFKQGLVKAELALCKGKEGQDKRRDLKEKEQKREVARALKELNYK